MANEKRLIDADALISRFCEIANRVTATDNWFHLDSVTDEIMDAPTVDAVEVVHGEWLNGSGMSRDGSVVYQSIDCSHCEEVFKIESETREYWKARFKVCPFCGAVMDRGN